MAGSRLAHEARRAQYEIPGMAAGLVAHDLERVQWLLDRHDERFGRDPLLDEVRRMCRRARDRTRDWMAQARLLTDYDAAREVVQQERARERALG